MLILATWQPWFIQGSPGKASNLRKGLPTWPGFYIGSLCKDFRDLRVKETHLGKFKKKKKNLSHMMIMLLFIEHKAFRLFKVENKWNPILEI